VMMLKEVFAVQPLGRHQLAWLVLEALWPIEEIPRTLLLCFHNKYSTCERTRILVIDAFKEARIRVVHPSEQQ
jgi:hypothetical protein